MSEKPLSKSQANLCGVSFGVSDIHAENWKLPVGRINNRKTHLGGGLTETVSVAGLLWRGQFVVEVKRPVLMDKVKRILVACVKTKKCSRVTIS